MEPVNQPQYQVRAASGTVALEQNRVLRNTYWLLALTMIPTIFGAWVGVNTSFTLLRQFPIAGPIVMLVAMWGLLFAIYAARNSVWGLVLTFVFTFVAGFFLGPILSYALALKNGMQLVAVSGGMTAAVFFTMAGIATVTKKDFSFLGKFLWVGFVVILLAWLANLFFAIPALSLTISAAIVILFSLWILYDVSNIINGGETNYVTAAVSLYVNIYNIFVHLLNLLLALAGQRD